VAKAAATYEKFTTQLSDEMTAQVKRQTEAVKAEVLAEIHAAAEPQERTDGDPTDQPDESPPTPGENQEALPAKPVEAVEDEDAPE
jgi:hypothetical protein